MYGVNFSEEVHSNTSLTAAANAIIKKLFPNNEKILILGMHIFGIYLKTLRKARENCCLPLRKLRLLKSIEFYEGVKFYGENQVVLKKVSYNVSSMDFQINYKARHDKENEEKLTLMVKVIDKNYITREEKFHTIINIPTISVQDELIFAENSDIFDPEVIEGDGHYTVILFPGVEKYELFEVIITPFIQELDDLKNYGLKINEIIWKFEFYFSSNWKFLSICLEFNSPNSNFFCSWCQISKHDQSNHNQKKLENKQID
ncbi:hypothetical protein RhiirA1_539465 [Rhizophagus irregularis]|uniref:Uncharacterized protein n=1 Tax=Rhizophagus irregularis TaxID=588596 RepID=A0A2I1FHT5_9GLOM|nr:hypothetical protein RhiirA1_539465 [Rhizophagus irregularis]PKY33944.1 hypothetical protein RhiirB3_532661 [Rhizophagus irregularis]